ncbi:MAG: arabinofuranosyltransferase [Candidatus Magasanikbacteria bacterium]
METLQLVLNFTDIQHLLWIKLSLFGFLASAVLIIYFKRSSALYLAAVGLFSGLAYFSLVEGTDLLFWGLKGDEITIAAMYEMFAHGGLFVDFAYASLPPFYPPLWFQGFGLLGRYLDFQGIQIAKTAGLATILVFPLLFYWAQNLIWDRSFEQRTAWLLSPLFVLITLSWSEIITKPYELVSVAFTVLWAQYLLVHLHEESLNNKKILLLGVVGGILFQIFYYWFILAAIGISLFVLFESRPFKKYWQLTKTALISVIVAAPYWVPLSLSYLEHGSENWQLGFWSLGALSSYSLDIEILSISSAVILFGLAVVLLLRDKVKMRALLSLLVAPFVWYVLSLITLNFFRSPLQAHKGMEFFVPTVLSLAAAYGVDYLWNKYEPRLEDYKKGIYILATIILSTQLIFGSFTNKKEVLKSRVRAKDLKPAKLKVKNYLKENYPNISEKTVLHTGLPELHAFLPMNDFIYFNQHNSHPAANFSARKRFLENLKLSKNSKAFYDMIDSNEFSSIDLFVFYKRKDDYYPVILHLDDFPHKIKQKTIRIPKNLLDEQYFEQVYENNSYVIYRAKKVKLK